jgi:integrase
VYWRADRRGWWASYIDAKGEHVRRKLKAATRQQALDERGSLVQGETRKEALERLGVTEDSPVTVKELFERYMKYQRVSVSKATCDRLPGILKTLEKHLPLEARTITRPTVSDFVLARAGEVSRGTLQKEFTVLSHILRLASEEWTLLSRNVAHGVKLPTPKAKKKNSKPREYLLPNELKAALQTAEPWMRAPMALAAISGGRRSEILALRWMHVDFEHQQVSFQETKNSDPRVVNIGEEGMRVLSSLPPGKPGDLLFPKEQVDPQKLTVYTRRVFHRLGLSFASVHTLRHTMASWQAMDGEPLYNIQQRLGHRTPRMTMRYAHLAPGYQESGSVKIDGRMAGVWAEPPANRILEGGAPSTPGKGPKPASVSHHRVTRKRHT